MADGVRIQPTAQRRQAFGDLAGRQVVLRDVARPLPPNRNRPACRTCGVAHECKTYHFRLDSEGTVTVSTGIWEQLKRMPDRGGFEQVNVVARPPAQGLVLPTAAVRIAPARM